MKKIFTKKNSLEHLIPDGYDEIPTFPLYHPLLPIRSLQTTLQHAEIIGREQELKCRFYQAFDRCWRCRAQVHGGVQLGSHHHGWVACVDL